MINKIFIAGFLFLSPLLAFGQSGEALKSAAFAPVKQSDKVSAALKEPDVFKEEAINQSGVASVSVPANMELKISLVDLDGNDKVTWKTYQGAWRLPETDDHSDFEVILLIRTFDKGFKEVFPKLPAAQANPESLFQLIYAEHREMAKQPDAELKEVSEMKLGDVAGEYLRWEYRAAENKFAYVWYAHKDYKGSAQRLELKVSSRTDEREKALKILKSLKFE